MAQEPQAHAVILCLGHHSQRLPRIFSSFVGLCLSSALAAVKRWLEKPFVSDPLKKKKKKVYITHFPFHRAVSILRSYTPQHLYHVIHLGHWQEGRMARPPSKLPRSLASGDAEAFSKLFPSALHGLNSQTCQLSLRGRGHARKARESVTLGQMLPK